MLRIYDFMVESNKLHTDSLHKVLFFFSPAVLKYGLVSQLRADHGLEFCLIESVQASLSNLRKKKTK